MPVCISSIGDLAVHSPLLTRALAIPLVENVNQVALSLTDIYLFGVGRRHIALRTIWRGAILGRVG